jgi:flagellar motility protein MotE (MotC chaperone)
LLQDNKQPDTDSSSMENNILISSEEKAPSTNLPEVITSEQIVTSVIDLADNLSTEQYYIFGGSWIELAIKYKGIDYSRNHGDIDIAVANANSIVTLQKAGYTLTEKKHIRETKFFSGTDKLGVPVEVMTRSFQPDDCLEIVIDGKTVVGRKLELEYLEKKHVIAMAERNSTEVRKAILEDVNALEKVIDREVVNKYVQKYANEEKEKLLKQVLNGLESKGVTEYKNLINNQEGIPEKFKEKVLSTLGNVLPNHSLQQIVESLDEVVNEYSIQIIRDRYNLKESF